MNALKELRRRENLYSKIKKGKEQNNLVEILVETAHGKQDSVAELLENVGDVKRIYKLIPFVAVSCEADIAEVLADYVHKSSIKNSEYHNMLKDIISVDISEECKIVPDSLDKRVDVYKNLEVSSLWNLKDIGAYDAQKFVSGQGINIAIIDTGIDYEHPQLRSRFGNRLGYDFVENNHDPMDLEGHGTHVSGTACSDDYGVSLESRLFGVRVLDEEGSGSESDVIAGIEWCIKNEIDIANMSLGSPHASRAFEKICGAAYDHGLMIVAAAGNESYGPSYPASFDESVIAVAAIDQNNRHAEFSNIWETNDISAPGVGIMSCYPGGGYRMLNGTSMATPHVTGTIALALSLFKQDPYQIEDSMNRTSQPLESSGNYENSWLFGSGLIRADKLIDSIMKNNKLNDMFRKNIYSNR